MGGEACCATYVALGTQQACGAQWEYRLGCLIASGRDMLGGASPGKKGTFWAAYLLLALPAAQWSMAAWQVIAVKHWASCPVGINHPSSAAPLQLQLWCFTTAVELASALR